MSDSKLEQLFTELGLSSYYAKFAEQEVDFDTCLNYSSADLIELGLDKKGPRDRLLQKLAQLRGDGRPPSCEKCGENKPKAKVVREKHDSIQELWLCEECCREVQDAFRHRGTITHDGPLVGKNLARPDPDTFVPYPAGKGPFATADPLGCMEIRTARKGVAAEQPFTVFQQFAKAVKHCGNQAALTVERDGKWQTLTWAQYLEQARRAGRALISLGLGVGESVNIIGFNSPEWLLANLGAIAAGGKAAGIYTTNQTEACKYIVEHSQARVVVVENKKQLDKFLPIRDQLSGVKAYVVYAEAVPEGANVEGKTPVYDWSQFMALGDKVEESILDERLAAQKPGHACTLIYTSGTTGLPKAVMISHDNATWTPQTLFGVMPPTFGTPAGSPDGEHVISYLPLSHIAAQMLDIHLPMAITAVRGGNCTVHFARPDALKGSLGATLKAVRPTIFFGVPRVWEKMEIKIREIGRANTGIKKWLGDWAKGKAAEAYDQAQYGKSGVAPFGTSIALSILAKVKAALGLERSVLNMTGAAPIKDETLRYFGSLGLEIYNLYGMSESSGPQNVSYPGHFLIGSCGPALPGCELKIMNDKSRDKPGEGEICYRGRHIMMGYMSNEEKTREAVDEQGWLHSGDVGRIDEFGFLHITGRIKELIITAGGENIAPVPMEDMIKTRCEGISNCIMIGDKKKFCSALITLHLKGSEEDGFTEELVGTSLSVGKAKTVSEAKTDPAWQKYIQDGIDYANANAEKNASKIQKFVLLDTDFSVKEGLMTSTLKLKRSIIHERFQKEIDSIYA